PVLSEYFRFSKCIVININLLIFDHFKYFRQNIRTVHQIHHDILEHLQAMVLKNVQYEDIYSSPLLDHIQNKFCFQLYNRATDTCDIAKAWPMLFLAAKVKLHIYVFTHISKGTSFFINSVESSGDSLLVGILIKHVSVVTYCSNVFSVKRICSKKNDMPGNSGGSSKNPVFTHKQHATYLKKYIYVQEHESSLDISKASKPFGNLIALNLKDEANKIFIK
ncbi:hypothetical protein ALC53_05471, partial [Atta colombica]